MRWVPDHTGRFRMRPHYQPEELDRECECLIENLLRQRRGSVHYPVRTDDLLSLLEQKACVDTYHEFLPEDGDVWGDTVFEVGKQPLVRLHARLASNERYENPFRTTIAHELGHVHFHGILVVLEDEVPDLFETRQPTNLVCRREHIEGPVRSDWSEWQAGYCSGAFLVPAQALRAVVGEFLDQRAIEVSGLDPRSAAGSALIDRVAESFTVSRDAARVRLTILRHLREGAASQFPLLD